MFVPEIIRYKMKLGTIKLSPIEKLKQDLKDYVTFFDLSRDIHHLRSKKMDEGICDYLIWNGSKDKYMEDVVKDVVTIVKGRASVNRYITTTPTQEHFKDSLHIFSKNTECISIRIKIIKLILSDIRSGRLIYKNGEFKRPFFKNLFI